MEVYFKNLSAEETPTERLVEDVMSLVDEAEDLVKLSSEKLDEGGKIELKSALERIKGHCERIRAYTLAGARQTDRFIRQHPYFSLSIAFGLGLVMGLLVNRKPED